MSNEFFPDGTPIDGWFYDYSLPNQKALGKKFIITDYGAEAGIGVQTEKIQSAIDAAFSSGGGVVTVPKGTFYTGALFFKAGVSLLIEKDGVLKGSEHISDYPVVTTRIEGQTCKYFAALINADNVDGFTVFGEGTIDGSGEEFWKAFWLRRAWNPSCTNKDEQRPRLLYVSNSNNVTLAGVTLKNSPYWTTHFYKCEKVKVMGVKIITGKPAPSTDGVDIDACQDVLVKNCSICTDDDGVVLKGGKGPYADTDQTNGKNERIIVEDCEFLGSHGIITLGSESVYSKNVLVRRVRGEKVHQAVWLKLRPDTPQRYEYVTVDGLTGDFDSVVLVRPWTQFFDLKGRTGKPKSVAQNITLKNCNCTAKVFFAVESSSDYELKDFTLENVTVTAGRSGLDSGAIENLTLNDVTVNER